MANLPWSSFVTGEAHGKTWQICHVPFVPVLEHMANCIANALRLHPVSALRLHPTTRALGRYRRGKNERRRNQNERPVT